MIGSRFCALKCISAASPSLRPEWWLCCATESTFHISNLFFSMFFIKNNCPLTPFGPIFHFLTICCFTICWVKATFSIQDDYMFRKETHEYILSYLSEPINFLFRNIFGGDCDLMVSRGKKDSGWLHHVSWGGRKHRENAESPESNVKFAPSQLSVLGFQNLVREYRCSFGLSVEATCGTLLISSAACGVFLTTLWIQVIQLANSPSLAYQPVTLPCCTAFDSDRLHVLWAINQHNHL